MRGLHKVNRRLADGSTRTHYYAWRGGPTITAAPGTTEFAAEFERLTASRDAAPIRQDTLQHLINEYQRNPAFTRLKPDTRSGYIRCIRRIETDFGTLPIKALSAPKVRGVFLDWRDRMGATEPRQADYRFAVLARILSWAYDRRIIPANPCERPGRLSSGSRAEIIWTEDQVAALLAAASPQVALATMLAVETGQRQRDVIRMTWTAYDGQALRLRQSKSGRSVIVPVTATLKAMLDAAPRRAVTICTTARGTSWTPDGFRTSFGKAKLAAEVEGVTFHDLRGTAVMRLARAGCTLPEIVAITGHSARGAAAILERHYLSADQRVSESAIAKLEQDRNANR
ncbi:Phage integrase family protein [Gemmobacter aquatilis]|uniref:Phage integrase family protein n=1 Tax=Gemmobacter aquatilis TaxID=933059 RepID=A0A1H8KPB5_9RHOB|nr:tyrosine-type recombinase/integrase [Gemmobacter aquatilis]SEN94714.1 Phage integrase family protein [Gemmobacter aquatilis]